jgi:hypothetical protein
VSSKIEKIIALKAVFEDNLSQGVSKANSLVNDFENKVKNAGKASGKASSDTNKLSKANAVLSSSLQKVTGSMGGFGKVVNSLLSGGKNFNRTLRETRVGINKFGKALSKNGGILGNFGKSLVGATKSGGMLTKALTAGTIAVVALTAAVALGAKATLDYADKLATMGDSVAKASQRMGVSTEFYQKMASAAQHSGTNITSMEMAMRSMVMKLAQVNKGSQEAVKAFEAIGVSVRDSSGVMRSQEAIYTDVLMNLSKMENRTLRNAKAVELLGESATQLVPLLNQGEDAINRYVVANGNAVAISSDFAAASESIKDSQQDIKEAFTKAKNEALEPFVEAMAVFYKNIRPEEVSKWGKALGSAISLVLKIGAAAVLTADVFVNAFVVASDILALLFTGVVNAADAAWTGIKSGVNLLGNAIVTALLGSLEIVNGAMASMLNSFAGLWDKLPGGRPQWLQNIINGREESSKFYKEAAEQSAALTRQQIKEDGEAIARKQAIYNQTFALLTEEMVKNQESAATRMGAMLRYIAGIDQAETAQNELNNTTSEQSGLIDRNVTLMDVLRHSIMLAKDELAKLTGDYKFNKEIRDLNFELQSTEAKLAMIYDNYANKEFFITTELGTPGPRESAAIQEANAIVPEGTIAAPLMTQSTSIQLDVDLDASKSALDDLTKIRNDYLSNLEQLELEEKGRRLKAQEDLNSALSTLEQNKAQELSSATTDAQIAAINKSYTQQETALRTNLATEIRMISEDALEKEKIYTQLYNNRQILAVETYNVEANLENTKRSLIRAQMDGVSNSQLKIMQSATKVKESLVAAWRAGIISSDEYSEKMTNITNQTEALLNVQDESAKGFQRIANAFKGGMEKIKAIMAGGVEGTKKNIFQLMFGDEQELDQYQADLKTKIQGIASEVFNQAMQLSNALGSLRKTRDENEIKSLEKKHKEELKGASKNANAQARLQAEQEKEMDALKKSQFEKDKKRQIAQVWINLASGIMSTWSSSMQLGPIAGPIAAGVLTGLLTGTAIAQSKAISEQQFAGGGVVGGFMGATTGPDTTKVEARPGEMFLNAPQQRTLFDSINNGTLGSSGTVNVNRGDIIIQGDVTNDTLDAIRQVDDEFLYKLRGGLETLIASGEVSFAGA